MRFQYDTETLSVALGESVASQELRICTEWIVLDSLARIQGFGRGRSLTTGMTNALAMAFGGSTDIRQLESVSMVNTDTIPHTVTFFEFTAFASAMFHCELPVNGSVTWTPHEGWCVYEASGKRRDE